MNDEPAETLAAGSHTGSDDELTWDAVAADPLLSKPPAPGAPGNVPPGEDLRLDIGWDRFEQLMVSVAQGILGLSEIQFRRYGTSGQAQHGIDLAGRGADGAYTVVQCKEYDTFTPADLRSAVATFAKGKRPFGARQFIVAVSTPTRETKVEEEFGALQDQHLDLNLELWGAEQINDVLRDRADIVSRFWTRETAETFCTGAPLPGVAAALPNWVRVADQILLSPLGVDGLDEQLAAADELRADGDPAAAAEKYQQLADTLAGDGFTGHAHLLRRRQADSIVTGDWVDENAAAELLGDLYARNNELERAAACYQWTGSTKKLTGLAAATGDRRLPPIPFESGPWWQQSSSPRQRLGRRAAGQEGPHHRVGPGSRSGAGPGATAVPGRGPRAGCWSRTSPTSGWRPAASPTPPSSSTPTPTGSSAGSAPRRRRPRSWSPRSDRPPRSGPAKATQRSG